MNSRIEQIINEIMQYIDACKYQPLSSTKIIVNKEEIEELLRELRMKTPDEIKRYQKIIQNKDEILKDAQAKADTIISNAQERAQQIISDNEVVRQAREEADRVIEQTNAQAQEIYDKALQEANAIRLSAISYTDEMLENLERIMSHTLDTSGQRYQNFMNSVQSCLDIVQKNRSELSPQTAPSAYTMPDEDDGVDAEE